MAHALSCSSQTLFIAGDNILLDRLSWPYWCWLLQQHFGLVYRDLEPWLASCEGSPQGGRIKVLSPHNYEYIFIIKGKGGVVWCQWCAWFVTHSATHNRRLAFKSRDLRSGIYIWYTDVVRIYIRGGCCNKSWPQIVRGPYAELKTFR